MYKRQVLHDVSFTIPENKITAIVGPSGSGKSTIAKLAARFWDIQSGKITVGGADICALDPEYLMAVSYTHLDVYKRQLLASGFIRKHFEKAGVV